MFRYKQNGLSIYAALFKTSTPTISKTSKRVGNPEQKPKIHQYKLQSHTSNAKYAKATEAVACAVMEINVIEGAPNIDNPDKNPMSSMTSNPIKNR